MNLVLTDEDAKTLDLALELYIRLGLGQVGEIAAHLKLLRPDLFVESFYRLLQEKEGVILAERVPKIEEDTTPYQTLLAFKIQSQLRQDTETMRWATMRARQLRKKQQ